MSNTAIEFRAPSFARSTAQRVADGVVAGYVRALASTSAESTERGEPSSDRLRDCDQGRASRAARTGIASVRRHPARRRALVAA